MKISSPGTDPVTTQSLRWACAVKFSKPLRHFECIVRFAIAIAIRPAASDWTAHGAALGVQTAHQTPRLSRREPQLRCCLDHTIP
jgi:hypothetical protein